MKSAELLNEIQPNFFVLAHVTNHRQRGFIYHQSKFLQPSLNKENFAVRFSEP